MRVTQYSLLAQVRRLGNASITQLADALDMDRTTLTRNLKPVLAAGWVEVRASTEDARIRVVRITRSGYVQLRAGRIYWRRAQAEVDATIQAAEVTGLHDVLDRCLALFRPVVEPEGDSE
ncbi:MAG: MarR family transcriptional regulator [Betaproteobacteria bacterium]